MEPILITTRDIMQLLKVSRATAERIGRESGAAVHLGRAVRYDTQILSAYLECQRIREQAGRMKAAAE